ncbi:MAG: nucleotidyltransferase family protein [Leptolyngbyaceae cyanobacterium]
MVSVIQPAIADTLRLLTEQMRQLYGQRLAKLILFGSHARGEARPESDIDILVVL